MKPELAVKQLPPKLARALKATMRQKKASDELRKKKDAQLATIDSLGAHTPSVDNPKEMDKAVEQQMSQEPPAGSETTVVVVKNQENPETAPVVKKKRGGPSNGPEECPICHDNFRPISTHMFSAHGDDSLGSGEIVQCTYCNKRMKDYQLHFHCLLRHQVPLPPHVQQVVNRRAMEKQKKKDAADAKRKLISAKKEVPAPEGTIDPMDLVAQDIEPEVKTADEMKKAVKANAGGRRRRMTKKQLWIQQYDGPEEEAIKAYNRMLRDKAKAAKKRLEDAERAAAVEAEIDSRQDSPVSPAADQSYGSDAVEAYRKNKGKAPSTPTKKSKKSNGVIKPDSIKKKHAEAKKQGAARRHLDAMYGITDGQNLDIRRGERVSMGHEILADNGEIIRPEDHEEAYGDLWTIYQVARATSAFVSENLKHFQVLDRAFDADRINMIEEQYEALKERGLVGRWDS